jgi:hypothetical protein
MAFFVPHMAPFSAPACTRYPVEKRGTYNSPLKELKFSSHWSGPHGVAL